jgi:2-methylcitrate dehydratase PrpD
MTDNTASAQGSLERQWAGFAANLQSSQIPAAVLHEAKRSVLNIIATTFSGGQEPAVEKALATMTQFSAGGSVSLVGRKETTDPALAAFLNAMAANIFDYDDNHPATIVHPSAPLAPALFAFAEHRPVSGAALLRAFILGGEIECRLGNAISPYHYARGWHITSTCGIFGAAVGVGALAGLSPQQFVWALGNAAAQSGGVVETLGTMSKSLSVGNAARLGLLSALLAADDYSGPPAPLSGERGFLKVYADQANAAALTQGLGEVWEIAKNTYKPYPAGIVLNAVIDAALAFAARPGFRAEEVVGVELRGNPFLRQRTDRPDVTTGREAQVSAQHAIAIAFKRGEAGLDAFSDAAVAETLRDGRPEIVFTDDPGMDIAGVHATFRMADGRVETVSIDAARGSPANPLTDAELEDKLRMLADRAGFSRPTQPLIDAIWSLDSAADAGAVSRLAAAV